MIFKRLKNIIRSRFIPDEPYDPTWTYEPDDGEAYSQGQQQHSEEYTQSESKGFGTAEAKYYAALELREGAGFAEIKAAYKRMVKKYHPDKFPHDAQKRKYAEQVTQQLNEAYRYFEQKFGQK